ncbi:MULTISPECIES: DUF3168 domain-containing protein [Mesorhizobium]|uniref:tail completion protein gp17 n=1 Tax=Mesorhizobium TaxID=68287 RepID=UPI0007A94D54|nr:MULTISPECIES: DUF3168 domain-containing protein [Mesorhizobium]AMX93619.1 hypothetical protein A4R28_11180 [Mesorhizobium ciceri]MDF3208310.1 DUF3168 domain-containing protein [Mesorhizobium sp. LMG15046]MDF3229118.1 DUF3168 domain-containing protein [Mesorhizobium sp. DSM 30133]
MSALSIAITKLKATSAVTTKTTAVRIYPIDLPQGATMPCLVVNIASGYDEHMLTGAGKYFRNRVTIECMAATPEEVMSLGDAVMTALQDNVNATIGAFTGVATQFADLDRTDYSDDRATYRRTLDFFIRWRS